MPWIESHTEVGRHRKTLLMAAELGIHKAQMVGHLHLLWHAVLEQQEDGDLSEWPASLIAHQSQYDGDHELFVSLLKKHRFLDEDNLIHDWLDYAGRYLEAKYQSSNYGLLKAIWKLHGRSYTKKRKQQMPSGWFKVRRVVLERDGHKCRYCGKPARAVDHVIPRSKGGTDELDNLVSACMSCNIKKKDKTIASPSFNEHKSVHPKGKVRLSPLGSSVSEEGGCKGGVLPDWLDEKTWTQFQTHRKEIKHPMTDTQQEALIKKLGKSRERGHDPNAMLEESTANGWQGVFEPKENGRPKSQDKAREAIRNGEEFLRRGGEIE